MGNARKIDEAKHLAVLVVVLGTLCTAAQEWPAKPVRIVVPFGAGATPDIVARLLADYLHDKLQQTFIVENKPGASGNTGTDAVAKSAPDGATLGVSIGGPLAINTLLFGNLPYDPRKGFGADYLLLTAAERACGQYQPRREHAAANLIDLIERNPGKYAYGSIGTGSLSQLAMEAIALKSGTQLVHVPYSSSPQAMTALIRNDVQMVCLPAISVVPQLGFRQDQNPCGNDRRTLGAVARYPDLEGSRHRRRSRCLERTHRAGWITAPDTIARVGSSPAKRCIRARSAKSSRRN